MKKIILFLIAFATVCFNANAQSRIINTIAGNGTGAYSGDGGPGTAAELNQPFGMAVDKAGNVYIADANNNRIRKVNPQGVITTFAGTGAYSFGGDGGPATAAYLSLPNGIEIDHAGNVYIADELNNRIRKVNTSGIITTIAGTGATGYSGDGGLATAAKLNHPYDIAFDTGGNLLFTDFGNNVIRRINTSGIISTIAGGGTSIFNGVPATTAQIYPVSVATDRFGNVYISCGGNIRKVNPSGIISTISITGGTLNNAQNLRLDDTGNIYIADGGNNRICKIDSFGTITVIAGNGTAGFSGDGGDATSAEINGPLGVAIGPFNILYISDPGNNRARIIGNYMPTAQADSFSVFTGSSCSGLYFTITSNSFSTGKHIKSYFDNGEYLDVPISAHGSTGGIASFYEPYNSSGIYTIKHVLYDGIFAVDSITYSKTVSLCQNIALSLYYDVLGTCTYDNTIDKLVLFPSLLEVDSNSVSVDTLSVTGGLYYRAFGNMGDIYTFKVISVPTGFFVSCPSTGIISDTLSPGVNVTKLLGFRCSSSTSFDLMETLWSGAGFHAQALYLNLYNLYCTPKDATLTITFSPKYPFGYFYNPPPSSVSGNIATWNLSGLSYLNSPVSVTIYRRITGAYLSYGDTVMTECVITPIIGDTDTLNNIIIRTDTVKAGFDPNEMSVTPPYCIPSGAVTQLQYTIFFENTGNDTAHNIYVMDTLSDNLDPRSLRIISASNVMNISKWYDPTAHNIYKFEFPKINLLDSSHHGQCDGMVSFNINTKAGLATGATVFNHAGIFFDDNPVVMTNTVENLAGCPSGVQTLPIVPLPTLYPNPATNELIIKADNSAYTSFTITNIVGVPVIAQAINTSETKVNVALLPAGVYFVTFKGENGDAVRRFVKI